MQITQQNRNLVLIAVYAPLAISLTLAASFGGGGPGLAPSAGARLAATSTRPSNVRATASRKAA